MKSVVICADDFGYSKKINEAILESVENGLVTSVAALVDGADVEHAAKIQSNKNLDLGLHLSFERYKKNGDWMNFFEKQLEKFVDLYKNDPSNLSIHASKYLRENISPREHPIMYLHLKVFCKKHNLFFRGTQSTVLSYKASESVEQTKSDFLSLVDQGQRSQTKLVEIIVHPGKDADEKLVSTYPDFLRNNELTVLTDSEVIKYTNSQVRMVSYRDLFL